MARKRKDSGADADLPTLLFEDASLVDEARKRYLSYALSVITARALPDVRDGLKPVQRRILYTMQHELHLRAEARYRKSAAIVGDVMGKFHPHGDTSIYDTMVRMAQSFTLQAPLVDGRGNFGSVDGDAAAAMRYTEAKLTSLAEELMAELERDTVAFRPNYDGTRREPLVLPARFPHLLINGSQGIAVGMATAFPPHAFGEVIDACTALIDNPNAEVRDLLKHIKGPDFPTGGKLQTTRAELERVYTAGQGSLKLYGEWKLEPSEKDSKGNPSLVITSIPYGVERRTVVEKIAEVIIGKKLPQLLDVRDESTEDCRVVCEMRKDSDPELIAAYLYRHTPLMNHVQVNLTALVPTDNEEVAAPKRLDLLGVLQQFLQFRMLVVTRRLTHDLEALRRRIHILEGLAIVFAALDEAIRLIRQADDRRDAAAKLMKRFGLDQEQVDAILELRLYKLAKLEIHLIEAELKEKRAEAKRIAALLGSDKARWQLIRAELHELKEKYAQRRRTRIVAQVEETPYDAEAFIVDEDALVVLTQQGWLKRQQRIKDLGNTRLRDGDRVLAVVGGSTRASVAFFSNLGACFTLRIADVPPGAGYGAPVQTLFKMGDGERIIAMLGFDARFCDVPPPNDDSDAPEPPYAGAVTRQGMCLRFSLRGFREPSTRSGRRYCRLSDGDEVLWTGLAGDRDSLAAASRQGRALICAASEVPVLAGAGKGVILLKLQADDQLVAAAALSKSSAVLSIDSAAGKTVQLGERSFGKSPRAGKGAPLIKRGELVGATPVEPVLPVWP